MTSGVSTEMVTPVSEIVLLWTGDDCSFGYASQELVVELCSQTTKDITPSYDYCAELLYPGEAAVPYSSSVIIRDGVKLWYHRNRPRH